MSGTGKKGGRAYIPSAPHRIQLQRVKNKDAPFLARSRLNTRLLASGFFYLFTGLGLAVDS